jgi:hypothetical protein
MIITEIVNLAFTQMHELISIYTDLDDMERSSDIYTYVALMVVIYSSFINYPVISFRTIINTQNLDNLIKYSQVFNQIKFYNTYLIKVIQFNPVYDYRFMFYTQE